MTLPSGRHYISESFTPFPKKLSHYDQDYTNERIDEIMDMDMDMDMDMLIPGFLSPPLAFRYTVMKAESSTYSSSVHSESQESPDSMSDGDSGISINESTSRPRFSRSSNPRSRNGCFTCRQRKVKCNEVRPKCGPCTRLGKECDWNYRWKFDDLSIRTQKKHKNVNEEGSPVWDTKAERPNQGRKTLMNERNLSGFSELLHDGEREERAVAKPAGTYNVILTQDSFQRLPQYGKVVKRRRGDRKRTTSPSQEGASSGLSSDEDPDVVFLSDFEDTPFSAALPSSTLVSRKKNTIEFTAQVSFVSSIAHDITDYGIPDQGKFVLHYTGFVTKRIMPLGSRFGLGGPEDAIVLESKKFRPLHHAICAVSMLSVALKGQRSLLAGAYQHYHQAISACMSCTDATQGQLLYLHFILLVYDIVCATQNGAQDEQMVGQHLQHLSRIAYQGNGQDMGELHAYLLWYVLFLDGSSCLAGNKTSGAFTQAYITNKSTLPAWRRGQTVHQKTVLGDDYGVFTTVQGLSGYMCSQAAQMSQLAINMRTEAEQGKSSVVARQKAVSDFNDEMRRGWGQRFPIFLEQNSAQAGEKLPVLARTVFDFVSFSTFSMRESLPSYKDFC